MRALKKLYLIFSYLSIGLFAYTQPTIGFDTLVKSLTAPVDIVNAKDGSGRLFIVQQNGIVRLYSGGSLLTPPFLNMSSVIAYGGELGLLSIAFHPQYATNRYFFVYYNNAADSSIELAQYRTSLGDPNLADAASRKVLLTIPKPFSNHNGGKLNFGPDGNLYVGTGDGGGGGDPQNLAQNLNSLLGKMIRINVNNFDTPPYYTVPTDNPLVGTPNTQPEIYGWGLRNPWRWNFDRQTGDMWVADVGQGAWEEVNYIPAASTSAINYGWRCYEGSNSYDLSQCGATPLAGKTPPIFEYAHNASGGYSISGGLVYRGTEYPVLQGYYVCADFVTRNGWLIRPDGLGGWNVIQQTNFPANVTTFGDAEDGTLYLASLGGTIFKVTEATVLPVKLLSFQASAQGGRDLLKWSTTSDVSLVKFDVEQSADGTRFTTIGTVSASTGNIISYSFETPSLAADRYYRLKMIYRSGNAEYSAAVPLPASPASRFTVTTRTNNQLQLTAPVALESLTLINTQGQLLQRFTKLNAGTHILTINKQAPGVYFLQGIKKDNSVVNLRVVLH